MSDIKLAKDSLVSSLFELSKSAQEAANATINFYRAASQEGNADSLAQLANTLNAIATSVSPDGVVGILPQLDNLNVIKAGQGDVVNGAGKKVVANDEKKRKKAEKDPNAPKKPLTIFFAFSFHTREVIREERRKKGLPALSAIEMNDVIKERWNSITPDEKAKWQKKYANELKEYQKVKEAYKAGLTGENKVAPQPEEPQESSDSSSDDDDDTATEDKNSNLSQDSHKKSKDSKKRKSEKSERKAEKKSKNKESNNK